LNLHLGVDGWLLLGICWLLYLTFTSFFIFAFVAQYLVQGGGLKGLRHTVVNWQTDIAIGVLIYFSMAALFSLFWGTHA
jgi:hypothetical protein